MTKETKFKKLKVRWDVFSATNTHLIGQKNKTLIFAELHYVILVFLSKNLYIRAILILICLF
jgi:hypothetical protein